MKAIAALSSGVLLSHCIAGVHASDAGDSVHGDFDGDGVSDTASLSVQSSTVTLTIQRGGSASAPQVLEFAVDPAVQDAICGLPATLATHPSTCSPMEEQLPGCREIPGTVAVTLSGGECDPVHLYWDHDSGHMAWWRL